MPAMPEGVVPQNKDEETSKTPKTNGEAKRAQKRTREEERADEKKQQPTVREELREEDRPVIPYKKAKSAIKTIAAIQDEHKVIVSPRELLEFKNLLLEFGGFDQKVVNKMTDGEIVAEAQSVLRNAKAIKFDKGVSEYKEEEIEGTGTHLKVEKALAKKLIAKAQSYQEETLTVQKVNEYLIVEEFETAKPEKSGPGAMAAAKVPIDMSFKELLVEKLNSLGLPITPRLQDVESEILRRVHSGDPEWINTAMRDLEALRATREHDPVLLAQIDQVLDPALQEEIAEGKKELDDKYTRLLAPLTTAGREGILKDLDDLGDRLLSALRYGTLKEGAYEGIIQELVETAKTDIVRFPELPGLEGVRVWYALRVAENTINAYEIEKRTQVRTDPHENIRSAYEAMTFFEKSRSVEGFAIARQRLSLLLEAVEHSTDPTVTQEMKGKLREHIEAFQRVTPVWITMYQKEGDPEAMYAQLENILDETVFYYVDRYGEIKDRNGRLYLVDNNGKPIVDAKGKPLNIESETINAFIYQYMVDRFKMNQVQEMTKRGLNINSKNQDELWIIQRLQQIIQDRLTKPNPPNITPADYNEVWNSNNPEFQSMKKRAVWAWHNEQNFIGVDGFKPGTSMARRDVMEEAIIQTILRNSLLLKGVNPSRIDELLGDKELIDAVKLNAAHLTRFMLGSTLDRLRVYDSKDEVVASLYGEETPFMMREVDHMPDFFLSEGHGDDRAVKLLMKRVEEKWGGFMIASNQVAYRFIANILDHEDKNPGTLPPNFKDQIDNAIKSVQKPGQPIEEVDHYTIIKMLHEGYDPNAPGLQQLELFNVDWSEASKAIDHYVVIDNGFDRINALKTFRGVLKEFLFRPTDENVFKLIDGWASTRHIRKKPAAEFFMELYWEFGHHWKEWFDFEENITSAQMETTVQRAIEDNTLDKKRGEKLKTKLLGRPLFRTAKQTADFTFWALKSVLRPGFVAGRIFDFFKTLLDYLFAGFK